MNAGFAAPSGTLSGGQHSLHGLMDRQEAKASERAHRCTNRIGWCGAGVLLIS